MFGSASNRFHVSRVQRDEGNSSLQVEQSRIFGLCSQQTVLVRTQTSIHARCEGSYVSTTLARQPKITRISSATFQASAFFVSTITTAISFQDLQSDVQANVPHKHYRCTVIPLTRCAVPTQFPEATRPPQNTVAKRNEYNKNHWVPLQSFHMSTILSLITARASLVAVFGIYWAFRQTQVAARALKAQVLMKLIDEWRSKDLYESIRYVHKLRAEWKTRPVNDWPGLARDWVTLRVDKRLDSPRS